MSTSPLLTKAEAAEFLGISPRTLDDWRAARALPCIERPGYVRFLKSDLEAFLQAHRVESITESRRRSRGGKAATA